MSVPAKSQTKEYRTWRRIIERCHNPEHDRYPWYGARGIKVCEAWRASYEAFLADVGPAPSPAHTIDRFPDNDGSYEPGNVRWATWHEQAQNRRSTVEIEHEGETLSIAGWAARKGMDRRVLWKRLQKGWGVRRSIEEPVEYRSPRKKKAA